MKALVRSRLKHRLTLRRERRTEDVVTPCRVRQASQDLALAQVLTNEQERPAEVYLATVPAETDVAYTDHAVSIVDKSGQPVLHNVAPLRVTGIASRDNVLVLTLTSRKYSQRQVAHPMDYGGQAMEYEDDLMTYEAQP